MVKVLGITFVVLLAGAHVASPGSDAIYRPLSMFRDYEPRWVGYALFGVLLAIGAEATRTAYRVQCFLQSIVYFASTALLAVVTATPSLDALHSECTIAALVLLFVNFEVLLFFSNSVFWFIMHAVTVGSMVAAIRVENYGIVQKSLILYFVAATIVHVDVLTRMMMPRRSVRPVDCAPSNPRWRALS